MLGIVPNGDLLKFILLHSYLFTNKQNFYESKNKRLCFDTPKLEPHYRKSYKAGHLKHNEPLVRQGTKNLSEPCVLLIDPLLLPSC